MLLQIQRYPIYFLVKYLYSSSSPGYKNSCGWGTLFSYIYLHVASACSFAIARAPTTVYLSSFFLHNIANPSINQVELWIVPWQFTTATLQLIPSRLRESEHSKRLSQNRKGNRRKNLPRCQKLFLPIPSRTTFSDWFGFLYFRQIWMTAYGNNTYKFGYSFSYCWGICAIVSSHPNPVKISFPQLIIKNIYIA